MPESPMPRGITRRSALQAAAAGLTLPWGAAIRAAFADDEIQSHGLSAFGDLALPADFKHFDYVNPDAPKGGLLSLQITATGGNQNFDTFDTLNMFSKKGDGAAGMTATFDNLMTSGGDEPDSVYGLVARAVRYTADKLTYRFLLRPEARFNDGSKLTASDVVFSLQTLKASAPRPTTWRRSASLGKGAATPISSSPACRSSRRPGGRRAISTRR